MITTLSTAGLAVEVDALLAGLGVARQRYTGGTLTVRSPISGEVVAAVQEIDPNIARNAIDDAHSAFLTWRNVPAAALDRCFAPHAPDRHRASKSL
jgi:aldehyde dehydrogenase (NAD+)